MNTFFRIATVILMLATVGMGVGILSATRNAQDLGAQLDQAQAELQKLKFHPNQFGSSDSDSSRQLLDAQVAANDELRKEIAKLKSGSRPSRRNQGDSAGPATAASSSPVVSNNRPNTPSAWMEQLRQTDPERYKQVAAAVEQRRKQADDWYNDTMNQLEQRAQAAAAPAEADLVNQIADTIAKATDLRQQMQAARELPQDQAQTAMAELMPEMQSTMQQLSQLRDQDRTLQLQKLAGDLGLKDDKVQALVDGVPQIYKATQYNTRGGGGGYGGFGGMGGMGAQPTAPVPITTSPKR